MVLKISEIDRKPEKVRNFDNSGPENALSRSLLALHSRSSWEIDRNRELQSQY